MDTSSPAPTPDHAGYQVDDLIVDLGSQQVTRAGTVIPLPVLSFDLLLTLVRAAPNLVTFEQLTERVWPGLVITPETISQRVKLVRSALGDDPHAPRYIGGVRGRGYRMVAQVRPVTERRRTPESIVPHWLKEAKREGISSAPIDGAAAAPSSPSSAASAPPPAPAPAPGPLGWVGGILVIVALLALPWGITHYRGAYKPAEAPSRADSVIVQPPQTIAVLPLVDVSPGGGNAYLGDGLAQELSARLARIHGLRVASRTSASVFKDRAADVRTIAQTLGVRHILEGSVHREGDQLRVTAQLIDAASGYNVWSQTYNRTWVDLLAIEDDVARSIIGTLKVVLTSDAAQRAAHSPTTQPAAFDLYLAGLAKLHGPPAGMMQLEEAADRFRQAIALDPKFALGYAGLCQCYATGYDRTWNPALVAQAESACGQALKLDSSLREVSAALAHLYLVSGRDEQAAAIYREAIRTDPDNADGYIGLGLALDAQQRSADAERAFRQAVDAEPTYWAAQTELGNFLFRHGRSAEGLKNLRRVTELIPASPLAFNGLGAALLMTGDVRAAAPVFERSLALEPTRSAYSNSGTVYYFLGRYADAARMFSRATELAAEDHRVWGNLADALWQIDGSRAQAQQDYRRAIALAQRRLEVEPKDGISWILLAHYSARTAEADRAEQFARRALELGPDDMNVHYYRALIALEKHDSAGALESLNRAVALGYPVQLVRVAPDFLSLHGDARFRQLLAQADKPPAG